MGFEIEIDDRGKGRVVDKERGYSLKKLPKGVAHNSSIASYRLDLPEGTALLVAERDLSVSSPPTTYL